MTVHQVRRLGFVNAYLVEEADGLTLIDTLVRGSERRLATMSPAQQKLMQYLPVVFAVFQIFFLTGLVIYYMAQAILRIAQQGYITRRFYGHDESLGRSDGRGRPEAFHNKARERVQEDDDPGREQKRAQHL